MDQNGTTHEHTHGECGKCGGCSCGGMHCGWHWKHVIVRVLIALFIFWCGVQFGELKTLLHGGGYANFGTYDTRGGMMGGWSY